MKIDLSKMRYDWFKDINGNVIDDENKIKSSTVLFCHSCSPCQLVEDVGEYCWHPQNPIVKFICKNRYIYDFLSKGKRKSYRHIFTSTTSYRSKWSQDCIVAMVNSGDYTLEQAIWVFTHACERCMNVLLYKYLDGKEGYEEYSEEWQKTNTVCDFCKE